MDAAHAAGIVHRDLKPHNVLLAADGTPKVTDFGLAKRGLGTDLTGSEAVMGTPAYMSPEQAGGGTKFVGPESDVWALGVMLYELLAGAKPFAGPSNMDFVLQILGRQFVPLRKTRPEVPRDLELIVAKCLRQEPRERYATAGELAADLRNWLDGRPISARPMGSVEAAIKWARRNPVVAVSVAFAMLAMAVGTVVSLWQASEARFQAQQARTAEAIAIRKTADEQAARHAETVAKNRERERADSEAVAKRQAEEERSVAIAVRDFLQSRLLRPINPWDRVNPLPKRETHAQQRQESLTVRDLLDAAATDFAPEQIRARFPNQPVVQAEILETIGATYDGLKAHSQAVRFLRAAFTTREQHHGPLHAVTLTTLVDVYFAELGHQRYLEVATILVDLIGRCEKLVSSLPSGVADLHAPPPALQAFDAVLKRVEYRLDPRRFTLPPIAVGLADSPLLLLKAGQAMLRVEGLAKVCVERFGKADERTLLARMLVGFCRHATRRVEDARAIYEEVYEVAQKVLPRDHWKLCGIREVLVVTYSSLRIHPAKQVQLRREVFESQNRALGPKHPTTLLALAHTASDDTKAGRYAEAIEKLVRALNGLEQGLGRDHVQTLDVAVSLAYAYTAAKQYEKAVSLHQRLYEEAAKQFGPMQEATLTRLNNYAVALQDASRIDDAIKRFEQLRPLTIRQRGAEHRTTLLVLRNLAFAYQRAGRLPEAIALMESTLTSLRKRFGWADEDSVAGLSDLRAMFAEAGQRQRLIQLTEEEHAAYSRQHGPNHPNTLISLARLANEYRLGRKPKNATTAYIALLAAGVLPPTLSRDTLLRNAVWTADAAGNRVQAEKWQRELIDRTRVADREDSLRYATEQLRLGYLLARWKRWAGAEVAFRVCLDIREKPAHAEKLAAWVLANARLRLGEALFRLGRIEEATPLVVPSYKTMKAEQKRIPADQRWLFVYEAASRAIDFCEATGQQDEAKRIRKERDADRETCPSPRPVK